MTAEPDETYPATPELDRMAAQRKRLGTQAIGEFLEWASDRGLAIAEWSDHYSSWYPFTGTAEELLARYAGIDLDKVEAERRAVLKWVQTHP